MRVRERLSAPPGHVIGQGSAPGGRVVPRGGGAGGGGGGGESDFPSRKLTCWSKVDFPSIILTVWDMFRKSARNLQNRNLLICWRGNDKM